MTAKRELTELARHRAGGVWAMRARIEREAAARFRRMAERLEAVGADAVVTGLARRATDDESRHAGLCDGLAARFSPGRRLPGGVEEAPECAPGGLTPRERVLYEVVAMSCITESVSAALLVELRDGAVDRRVHAVLHEILRDEVGHARLGWAHLASELRRGPQAFLAAALPAMLEGTASEEVFRGGESDAPEVARALRGLGALPRGARRGGLVEALLEVVFPGFERFGIDTAPGRAWLALRRSSAPPDAAGSPVARVA